MAARYSKPCGCGHASRPRPAPAATTPVMLAPERGRRIGGNPHSGRGGARPGATAGLRLSARPVVRTSPATG